MRSVAGCTAFQLERTVLKDERPLLVGVALDAGRVDADGQLGLLLVESSVRIMAIAALHCSFEHFVMERLAEL